MNLVIINRSNFFQKVTGPPIPFILLLIVLFTLGRDGEDVTSVFWILFAGLILGYLIGGSSVNSTESRIIDDRKTGNDRVVTLPPIDKRNEGTFLTFVTATNCIYVYFYYWAAHNFATLNPGSPTGPIHWAVVSLTAVTIGASVFFAVRYAAYVRLMRLLEAELKSEEPDEKRIYALRTPIFRAEQLYEPAGNIFVTVGITATFLGLAVGLVTLDLRALLDATTNVERARPLTAFIGCMGLALGVSMLGVITALAAQCLRGQGAAETTESLLARAAEHGKGVSEAKQPNPQGQRAAKPKRRRAKPPRKAAAAGKAPVAPGPPLAAPAEAEQ